MSALPVPYDVVHTGNGAVERVSAKSADEACRIVSQMLGWTLWRLQAVKVFKGSFA